MVQRLSGCVVEWLSSRVVVWLSGWMLEWLSSRLVERLSGEWPSGCVIEWLVTWNARSMMVNGLWCVGHESYFNFDAQSMSLNELGCPELAFEQVSMPGAWIWTDSDAGSLNLNRFWCREHEFWWILVLGAWISSLWEAQNMNFDEFHACEPKTLKNHWFFLGFEEVRSSPIDFGPAFDGASQGPGGVGGD